MNSIPSILISLIKRFEGLRLQSYKCPAGIWTIGYGHTGKDVLADMKISEREAHELLIQDISKTLNQVFKVSPILANSGENRISAIGDFVFNLGIGRYRNSTLRKCVDVKDWYKASLECRRWVFAGGKKLQGLIIRREVEVELLRRFRTSESL